MRKIVIRRFYPYEIGRRYNDDHYPIHVSGDADVVVDGRVVAHFRKRRIPDHRSWFRFMSEVFSTPLLTSRNRKTAMSEEERRQNCRSGILGFFDGLTPQMKKKLGISTAARPTAFLKRFPREWRRLLPFARHVDRFYQETCPEHHRRQEQEIHTIHPDLRIEDTVFSTITVNQNWPSGIHMDSGDFTEGMSCLAVVGKDYEGGSLGFPRLGVLLRVRSGDIVLMDSHEPHGNTPVHPTTLGGLRISLVFYLREKMSRFHRKWRVGADTYYLPE